MLSRKHVRELRYIKSDIGHIKGEFMDKKEKESYVDKKNNISRGPSTARRQFATFFQFVVIATALVVVIGVLYLTFMKDVSKNKISYSDAKVIQFDKPSDDTPVVVYETNLGTFKAVLFEDEAPKYCEYFKKLVNDGYYDGTHIFAVQDGVYFIGGSKTSNGVDDDDTDKTRIAPERSKDLWPFYGAVAAFGSQKSAFNKEIQSGSRQLFVGTVEFDKDMKAQLDEASDNKELNEAFKERGGVPNFSQQYTIFAQVYDGFDAYEKVIGAEVFRAAKKENDKHTDLRPKEDVIFEKVTISTYGENKNDEFFKKAKKAKKEKADADKADSSAVTELSSDSSAQ